MTRDTFKAKGDNNPEQEQDDTEQPARAQRWVDALNLKYEATFIPFRQSRNKDDKNKSINWRVTINDLTTDYMQGLAHVPGYKHQFGGQTVADQERDNRAAEHGEFQRRAHSILWQKLPAPELVDILYCLARDASVLDHASFQDWADEFGFDTDSRKAEATYYQCLTLAMKLRQMIDLDAARVAFEDY